MSISRGMDREDVVHIHNGIPLSHKENEVMPFAASWMDRGLSHSAVSQKEKEKYHTIPLLCGV